MTLCLTKKIEKNKINPNSCVNYLYVFKFPEDIFPINTIENIVNHKGMNHCEFGKKDTLIDTSCYMPIFDFIRPQDFCYDLVSDTLNTKFVDLFSQQQIMYLINHWDCDTIKNYTNVITNLENHFNNSF